ncbi:MAG: hypothetical protein C0599_08690 [Salinivirgaceae bacterium]|nr:MAG: hypothetical protein C0599_08690 [Salinivirgaceae bacterium]
MRWRLWRLMYLKIKYLLLFLFAFQALQSQSIDQAAIDLLTQVDSSLSNSNGLKFKMAIYARMKGNDYNQEALFKIQRSPLKVYYRQFIDNNIELLYDETKDKEKAIINPDGFPYTNLQLSPYSSLILKRQHHNVFEADPLFTIDQLKRMFDDCLPDKCSITISDTLVDNKPYKVLQYFNPHYKIQKVKVEEDIHILDFARKLGVNFYSIVCFNEDFDSSSEFDKGEILKVPSSYAKKILLIVNPSNNQVFEIQVFDGKGLFEKMRYLWFKKDVEFEEIDFQKENPEYNF